MNKYIDVETLKAEITRIYNEHPVHISERYEDGVDDGYHGCCDEIIAVIDSFQQEQQIGEEYAIKIGKHTHTLRVGSQSDIDNLIRQEKQEQPEVDLEEEVRNYMEIHHLHIKDGGRVVFDNGDSPNFMCDIREIARHFCEYGMSVMRERITNPGYNKKVIEKIKSEYPMDESNARKEENK